MSGPVGIALVGMGWWGQKMLNVLQAAPDDIRVVRAVEPNIDAVRGLCADKGIALTADYADALSDQAVEAVILATPHSLHTAQIEAAVAAGKHIFCEKPLALTKAEAESSVALCRAAGLVLGMGHDWRWEPNPGFKLFTVATGNDNVRLAVQWAIAEATGGTPPSDEIFHAPVFENSVSGKPNAVQCGSDLPGK